jgi:hypothetical protein
MRVSTTSPRSRGLEPPVACPAIASRLPSLHRARRAGFSGLSGTVRKAQIVAASTWAGPLWRLRRHRLAVVSTMNPQSRGLCARPGVLVSCNMPAEPGGIEPPVACRAMHHGCRLRYEPAEQGVQPVTLGLGFAEGLVSATNPQSRVLSPRTRALHDANVEQSPLRARRAGFPTRRGLPQRTRGAGCFETPGW